MTIEIDMTRRDVGARRNLEPSASSSLARRIKRVCGKFACILAGSIVFQIIRGLMPEIVGYFAEEKLPSIINRNGESGVRRGFLCESFFLF